MVERVMRLLATSSMPANILRESRTTVEPKAEGLLLENYRLNPSDSAPSMYSPSFHASANVLSKQLTGMNCVSSCDIQ